MRRGLPIGSVMLVTVALASPVASQGAPRVRTGEVDACYGSNDSYWYDSLRDAIADRAPFICACHLASEPARVTMAIAVRSPGVIASCEPAETLAVSHDEASCVAHRVHTVAHAWLASTVQHIGARRGASSAGATIDFAEIRCPAPGGSDTQSGLSRAFLESHPDGLRRDIELPAPSCRRPLSASMRFPFAW